MNKKIKVRRRLDTLGVQVEDCLLYKVLKVCCVSFVYNLTVASQLLAGTSQLTWPWTSRRWASG